jgi:hypothetical protein
MESAQSWAGNPLSRSRRLIGIGDTGKWQVLRKS